VDADRATALWTLHRDRLLTAAVMTAQMSLALMQRQMRIAAPAFGDPTTA